MTTNTDKAENMNRYFVSFDLVCTFTGELKTCFAGEVEAETAEIAVIFAHDKVRKEQRIFGKPVNVQTLLHIADIGYDFSEPVLH
tara:strand:+ start:47 stop:301 length:255 start_codon:yes stop_codon:yes gene_type:complete